MWWLTCHTPERAPAPHACHRWFFVPNLLAAELVIWFIGPLKAGEDGLLGEHKGAGGTASHDALAVRVLGDEGVAAQSGGRGCPQAPSPEEESYEDAREEP